MSFPAITAVKFDTNSVREFYKPFNLEENPVHFTKVSENTISDFLKEIKTNKATGIDNLSGRFLKDGSKVSPSNSLQSLMNVNSQS